VLLFTAGTITALALYIPFSAWALRRSTTSLSNPVIWRSIVAGVLFHGLVTFLAVI
jgi:hypothetical protein